MLLQQVNCAEMHDYSSTHIPGLLLQEEDRPSARGYGRTGGRAGANCRVDLSVLGDWMRVYLFERYVVSESTVSG